MAEMEEKITLDNIELKMEEKITTKYIPARCSNLHRKKQRAHAQKKNRFPVNLRKEICREKKAEIRYNRLNRNKLRDKAILATMYD